MQTSYHRIFGKPGVCVPDVQIPDDYYYDQDDDYYKPCYKKCGAYKFPGNDNSPIVQDVLQVITLFVYQIKINQIIIT